MAKKVTLVDIAERAGVSNVAVHKALTDKPGVSDEMRRRIKALAEEMGYRSPSDHRSPKGHGGSSNYGKKGEGAPMTGNIGVIIPEQYYGCSVSYYGQLYENVVKALCKKDYYGILELLAKEDELAGNTPRMLRDHKVDGLIFLGQMQEQYIKEVLARSDVPVIFLDTYHPELMIDTVISDGFYGTYMLTEYLIRTGHKRIGFVGSADATSSISDRYWGYRMALRKGGIHYRDHWEIPDRDENGRVYDRIISEDTIGSVSGADRKVTDSADTDSVGAGGAAANDGELDALVCNCDYIANIVIENLEAMGKRVPEDLSVTGFDDFQQSGREGREIDTYIVDMEYMAYQCVRTLLRKIRGKKYTKGIQVITGEMVCKKTVKDRRQGYVEDGA